MGNRLSIHLDHVVHIKVTGPAQNGAYFLSPPFEEFKKTWPTYICQEN